MAEADQATVDRARATLLAHLNEKLRREEEYFANLSGTGSAGRRYTAEDLATWRFAVYEEWLLFGPPGDNYGAPVYLVSDGIAYRVDLTRESYDGALASARALKARAGR